MDHTKEKLFANPVVISLIYIRMKKSLWQNCRSISELVPIMSGMHENAWKVSGMA